MFKLNVVSEHSDFSQWFHWNPEREAFRIPIIDHPVVWYGIFFAIGFCFAYFIFQYILSYFLLYHGNKVSPSQILDWNLLYKELKDQVLFKSFFKRLNKRTVVAWESNSLTFSMQNEICKELNVTNNPYLLHQNSFDLKSKELVLKRLEVINPPLTKSGVHRVSLEALFPLGLTSIKKMVLVLTDRLLWYVVLATLIGARLGHVLFYDWDLERFAKDPLSVFRVWEGGLASHGGAVGVLVALLLYRLSIKKYSFKLTFLRIADFVCIPTALVGMFIRLGNFCNQEIIGKVTYVPWAIVFENPFDGSSVYPRHPAQLYEGGAYLLSFILLMSLWFFRKNKLSDGLYSGLFFTLLFTARFIIEFYKEPQSLWIKSDSLLNMGHCLSIPFIVLGVFLLVRYFVKSIQVKRRIDGGGYS